MTIAALQKQVGEAYQPAQDDADQAPASEPTQVEEPTVEEVEGSVTAEKSVPAAIPFAPVSIDPRWDVAQIATPGHVLTARVQAYTHLMYPRCILLFIFAVGLFFAGQLFLPRLQQPPEALIKALAYDPSTYFKLGGGLNGPPEMAWLNDYAPKVGLTVPEYSSLVEAVAEDIAQHQFDAAAWEKVAALKKAPMITRPEKVFNQHGQRLEDGVISIPEMQPYAVIIAHVQGQWGITLARGSQCRTVQGPLIDGCEDGTEGLSDRLSDNAYNVLYSMAPAAADATEKE